MGEIIPIYMEEAQTVLYTEESSWGEREAASHLWVEHELSLMYIVCIQLYFFYKCLMFVVL